MQEEKTKNDRQKFCDMYVNWAVFFPIISFMLIVMMAVIGVAMSAKAESGETKIKVDNIGQGIQTLNEKFDKITEIKIKQ